MRRALWYNYTTQTNEVHSFLHLIFMMSHACCDHTILRIQPVFRRILPTRFETRTIHQTLSMNLETCAFRCFVLYKDDYKCCIILFVTGDRLTLSCSFYLAWSYYAKRGHIHGGKNHRTNASNGIIRLQGCQDWYCDNKKTHCLKYKYAQRNDVSVNEGSHIRRWSHNIIIS